MAYYNPNRVDFNPSTMTIQAVGAVGRSLWDIYKDTVAKNQNQMKIDEATRHNEATEQHNADSLANTKAWQEVQKANADRAYTFDQDKFAYTKEQDAKKFELDSKKLNADIALKNAQLNFNNFWKNQTLLDRQEKAKEKEHEITLKMQAGDDELRSLASQYADDSYIAGHFKALRDDGTIDQEALTNAIVTTFRANPRSAVSGINKILSEKKAYDTNNAQSQAIKAIATLQEQLGQIPQNATLDDYDGWVDRLGDNINMLKGSGADKKAVEGILAYLQNAGYQMVKTGRGTDDERKKFNKEYEVTLDSGIFDNDKFAKGQKLLNLTMPSIRKELEMKRDSVSNQYAKKFYSDQLKELDAVETRLNGFFGKKTTIDPNKFQNITEY